MRITTTLGNVHLKTLGVIERGCDRCFDLTSYSATVDGVVVGEVRMDWILPNHPAECHSVAVWRAIDPEGRPVTGYTGVPETDPGERFLTRYRACEALLHNRQKTAQMSDPSPSPAELLDLATEFMIDGNTCKPGDRDYDHRHVLFIRRWNDGSWYIKNGINRTYDLTTGQWADDYAFRQTIHCHPDRYTLPDLHDAFAYAKRLLADLATR